MIGASWAMELPVNSPPMFPQPMLPRAMLSPPAMPPQKALSPGPALNARMFPTIRALAVYVHSLGGGE